MQAQIEIETVAVLVGGNICEMFFRANNSIEMPTKLTRSDKKLKITKNRKTIEKVTGRSLGRRSPSSKPKLKSWTN